MKKTALDRLFSGVDWPPLIPGTLIRRYKRFLADVELKTGETVTAHCPNSGKMTESCLPGQPVYISFHDNPRRKLKYTWELIQMPGSLVGVNTQVPNRLVAESLRAALVPELAGYDRVRREVKAGENSRLDILLTGSNGSRCFVEVKNCTLVRDGVAAFPDAVTDRGRKHLVTLQELAAAGNRCVMFYLIQRTDANVFRPADEIDPAYGEELRRAVANGVEVLAWDVAIDLKRIRLRRRVPYRL
ncbi:DNA/RNA nuclease SfsA [Desulfonema ishimotonii]|uniref:Sugar fermentation stimulation protein homolog n=1 Tax=Desulfonema ishimotonii TaxID=45657 RepID=A0A401FXQ3_9BACT|nr:DNA/RNA nuclease SfsA [Desulfonema ishimotonii]GBC61713.1 DNA/RNA nuclease SfsA [Desulfonema ishimotonii]